MFPVNEPTVTYTAVLCALICGVITTGVHVSPALAVDREANRFVDRWSVLWGPQRTSVAAASADC